MRDMLCTRGNKVILGILRPGNPLASLAIKTAVAHPVHLELAVKIAVALRVSGIRNVVSLRSTGGAVLVAFVFVQEIEHVFGEQVFDVRLSARLLRAVMLAVFL